ncbi:RNA polymerase sigma factor [Actinomadura sp. NTSP31]|uniref:RNA polymerase sigma factor n=1 Tax=Actinomadura sp. NTSP31 TaxID=1735447 RepID=UPI0035C19C53
MAAEELFTALYRAHYEAVLRYALRRTDHDAAKDVVAETFLVAWRRWAEVPNDREQALPWLYGVAGKVLAGTRRSRIRRHRLIARLSFEPRAETGDLAGGVVSVQCLLEALERLPLKDQEILRLAGWEELDLAAIAVAVDCSKNAAAVRLHRARNRLEIALTRAQDGHNDGRHELAEGREQR